jgi:hypothetical protein
VKWVTAEFVAKRRILETVRLSLRLDDVTLITTMRKSFDIFSSKGLLSAESRGDRHSFEPLIASCVHAVLSPSHEIVVAMRVMKLSA